MSTNAPTRSGEWLEEWDPEDPKKWDSHIAWRTLWITTFCLTLAFAAWFLPSAVIPKLNALGYTFSMTQLYWMAAMPGLSAGLFRLVWMVLPPIMGTRKMVSLTTLLLIASTLGWGVRVITPTAPYWELMVLAFLAGIGGGAFSGFMPSTSYFFPAPSRARPWVCKPAWATSVSRWCSCSRRISSACHSSPSWAVANNSPSPASRPKKCGTKTLLSCGSH